MTTCKKNSSENKERNKKALNLLAFTLSEVLLTLGIIGVVAALTIPNLVENYQKNQTAIQLKKVYSMFENAEKMAEVDYGPSTSWDYTLSVSDFMQTYYKTYLKLLKESQTNDDNNLFGKTINYTNINGDAVSYVNFGYRAILADGTIIRVSKNGQFIILSADINGIKGPNKLGRDVFDFELMWDGPKKLVTHVLSIINPSNRSTYLTTCKNSAYTGGSPSWCAAIIQYDDWQIKDDYPW